MARENKKLSDSELLRNLVSDYLNNHYQITIEDLEVWCGLRFCKYLTEFGDETYEILDVYKSSAVSIEANLIEVKEHFDLESIKFQPGDVVLDIGANVGLLSIYLAKKFPFLKIIAIEPIYTNCRCFYSNMLENKIDEGIITLERRAVTIDGQSVSMVVNPCNSKDYKIGDCIRKDYILRQEDRFIQGITFDDIFTEFNLDKVKLLRMDCNGDEHEILKNCSLKNLKKVENFVGEFYESEFRPDRNNAKLLEFCRKYIKNVKVVFRES